MTNDEWLLEQFKPYSALSVGLLDPHVLINTEGVIIKLSAPAAGLLGIKTKKAMGQPLFDLLKLSSDGTPIQFAEIQSQDHALRYDEIAGENQAGTVFKLIVGISPLKNDTVTAGYLVFLRDVTADADLLGKYADKSKEIIDMLKEREKVLERLVAEKTEELTRRNNDIASLLNGLTHGLFFFTQDGDISQERSQALERILPDSNRYHRIQHLLLAKAALEVEKTEIALDRLFGRGETPQDPISAASSLLPSEIKLHLEHGDERLLRLQYRPITNAAQEMDKILTIVDDITEKVKAEREALLQLERVKKITMAAMDQEGFKIFKEELNEIIERVAEELGEAQNKDDVASLKRDLHTLKGTISVYEFTEIAGLAHELEDIIGESQLPFESAVHIRWKELEAKWLEQVMDVEDVLGISSGANQISVEVNRLNALTEKAAAYADVKPHVDALFRLSPSIIFKKYEIYLKKICARDESKAIRFQYQEDSDEVSTAEIAMIDGALIHIFRNALDHGIEEIERRVSGGKPEYGTISIHIKRKDDCLILTIADDGGGINATKLAEKAVKSGIWSTEKRDESDDLARIQLIFEPSLSSRDEVTDTSGRGVGMDAVRSTLLALGGDIEVRSQIGKGTRFRITVPIQPQQSIQAA